MSEAGAQKVYVIGERPMRDDPPPPSRDILRLGPTEAYPLYWWFACERQRVFHAKLRGEPPPWTDDEVLREYKFTNAYRASDRASQALISDVILGAPPGLSPASTAFRVVLFKLFNLPRTWRRLEETLGEPVCLRTYDFGRYDRILTALSSEGPIYSAAYIQPPPDLGHSRKHQNHLVLARRIADGPVPFETVRSAAPATRRAFEGLLAYPSVGPFLAYQLATDLGYAWPGLLPESAFVRAGPGAVSGLHKCFRRPRALGSYEDAIMLMVREQGREVARLGLEFDDLFGRPLQPIDCQNLFCETDKLCRVRLPHVEGRGGRTRIKQRYTPAARPIGIYRYPPAWGINERAERAQSGAPEPVSWW